MAAIQDSQASGKATQAKALSRHRQPPAPLAMANGGDADHVGPLFRSGLAAALETRVLPWMVLAHRTPNHAGCCCDAAKGISAAEIAALADEARRNDLAAALARVECHWRMGLPLDRLYLELIGPAAVRLGQMWHEDTVSMAEVTVGLACLQRLIHTLGPAFHQDDLRPDPRRRILLAPMPGEQHNFALIIIAEFLRRAGWDVDCGRVLSLSALCALLRREWFALVGLSVSCTGRIDAVGGAIHALRAASRNRSLGVLVGGPMFAANPDLVVQVGADAMAIDARHAVAQAESLLSMLAPAS